MILEHFFRNWLENDQFEPRFIRFFAMRLCTLEISKFRLSHWVSGRFENAMRKPSLGNAFWMILEHFFRNWLENDHFEPRFIRVFATRFCTLEISKFRLSHWVSGRFENASRNHYICNAFLIIFGSFFAKGAQMSSFSIGFIRFFDCGNRHAQNLVLPMLF